MQFIYFTFVFIILLINLQFYHANNNEECSLAQKSTCQGNGVSTEKSSERYKAGSNAIYRKIQNALRNYEPCTQESNDTSCSCHDAVISQDLAPYLQHGITAQMIKDSAKYGTHYKILNHRLLRAADCMFPTRCTGIEHFLLKLLPSSLDIDFVVNTRDWPQLSSRFGGNNKVVFSFSKTIDYLDIMYPAWTFWAGGPAISLHPVGIGRWDLHRERIKEAAAKTPWQKKQAIGFFRGSRTSDERDTLVLLSRQKPDLVDAQYTKNQAWKSPKDTLNAEPAKEVSFEDHCRYKYLFNFRGVAASFRLKHLFLCKSLIFHVGDEWNEFFYFALKPWVHYVPINKYPSKQELEEIILFFRKHDDLAQEIAQRGFEFIWHHLRMEDVECYWQNLLKQYQKLLKYKVVEEKDLIQIK